MSIQFRTPVNLTLRDKLIEAERLTREMIQHLDQGFVPKAHQLRRVARQGNESDHDEITDMSVRSTADRALEADDFTIQLGDQLSLFLESIKEDLQKLTGR